jgi:signal transduction histidine kinase
MLCVLALLLADGPEPVCAQVVDGAQKKVLVLYLMRRDGTSAPVAEPIYQQTLTEGLGGQLDYYGEYVDLPRFGTGDYQNALRNFLKEKYKGIKFDVIIAVADLRNFLARYGAEIFPDTPVVFSISDDAVYNTPTPPNFTGIVRETDLRGTLDLILRLQPGVKQVFVITGASQAVDKYHEARARRQFSEYGGRLSFTYLSGLPIDRLKWRISNLAPDSVVYFVMMVEDGEGRRFALTQGLDEIAASSSVPVYSWYDGYLGHGIVGGKVISSTKMALQTSELALRILRGERVETMAVTRADSSVVAVDWRQFERWRLPEDSLPPGTEILYRTPTVWERYSIVIVTAVGVVAAQSILIAGLLLERRRRLRAARALAESQAQLTHMARVATIGDLNSSIWHELRQPLVAIRINAEAGVGSLSQAPPDVRGAREIFEDIAAQNDRASELIDHLGLLVRKEQPAAVEVDVNSVCRNSVKLLEHDAACRRIRLELSLDPELPAVRGDRVQLQQVVLNLARNALDAAAASTEHRKVMVGSAGGKGEIEIFVRDTGPGLSSTVQDHLFESFFTTKPNGLGLGLAMVRLIVERHHGRVSGENGPGGGAVFRVVLPAEPPVAPP